MNIFDNINDFRKYVFSYLGQIKGRLETETRILEAQNELAKVSSMNFVLALRPTLEKLSYMQTRPFEEFYIDCINEVKRKVLKGRELAEILGEYDMMLVEMKEKKDGR